MIPENGFSNKWLIVHSSHFWLLFTPFPVPFSPYQQHKVKSLQNISVSQHPHLSFCSLVLLFLLPRLSFMEASHLLTQSLSSHEPPAFSLGFSPWSDSTVHSRHSPWKYPPLPSRSHLTCLEDSTIWTPLSAIFTSCIGECGRKPHNGTDGPPFQVLDPKPHTDAMRRPVVWLWFSSQLPVLLSAMTLSYLSPLSSHVPASFIFARWPSLLHWKKVFRWELWLVHQQVCSHSIESRSPVSFSSSAFHEGGLPFFGRDWSLLFHPSHWCLSPVLSPVSLVPLHQSPGATGKLTSRF